MDIKSLFGFDIKPNFEHFKNVVLREKSNCRVLIIEGSADASIYEEITGEKFIRKNNDSWIFFPKAKNNQDLIEIKHNLNIFKKFWFNMGYDHMSYPFYTLYQLPQEQEDK